jgi:hypothetical protein
MDELTVGDSYLIEEAKSTTTQFGDAIVVSVSNNNDRFKVYLPKRFVMKLSGQNLESLKNVHMKYLGGKYNDIKFY